MYRLWDNAEKNMVETDSPEKIRGIRNACWITKATHTRARAEYVILTALPRQLWLRERASMLRLYVRCLSFWCLNNTMVYGAWDMEPSNMRNDTVHFWQRSTWGITKHNNKTSNASSRDSEIGIVSTPRTGRSAVRIPVTVREFVSPQNVQTSSGVYPAVTWFFRRGKVAGTWS